MSFIGIDFGTTNSILAYYEDGRPQIYVPSGGNGAPQIRSAVALNEVRGAGYLIGLAAFLRRKGKGLRLVDRFKMRLGLAEEAEIAAKAFLSQLVDEYKSDRGIKAIDGVVVTVPDQWLRERGQISHEALIRVCASLKLPIKKFLSEPVAASIYASQQVAKSSEPFSGYGLVYDHGGGTLDLSLVQIDGKEISTIDGAGVGPTDGTPGVGGTDFDAAVLRHFQDQGSVPNELTEEERARWLTLFEERKIALDAVVEDGLATFLQFDKASEVDDPLFDIEGVDVRPSDLVEAFERSVAPKARAELLGFFEKNKEILGDDRCYKVLIVGGFSNFYLVRRLVGEVLEQKGPNDPRFQTKLGKLDRSYATAYGAALLSADQSVVYESCPVDLSIWLKDDDGQLVPVKLLERGAPIGGKEDVRFLNGGIFAPDRSVLRSTRLRLVMNHGVADKEITTDFTAAEALPNLDHASRWRIGAFVDGELRATIVFETDDDQRAQKLMSLGEIVSRRLDKSHGH